MIGLGIFVIFGVLVLQRVVRYYIWMIKKKRFNQLVVACIAVVMIIVLRTMTDTGIIYGIYYLGVVFWTYLSAVVYFMDSEFTVGRKPFVAMIHDRIFHGKKESWKVARRQKLPTKKSGHAKLSRVPGTGD